MKKKPHSINQSNLNLMILLKTRKRNMKISKEKKEKKQTFINNILQH